MVGLALVIPSMLFAVLPMLALLTAVWWLDRYDREPVWLLTLTFLWGAIGGVLFGVVGSLTLETPLAALGVNGIDVGLDWIGPAVIAPLAEEPAKALFLFVVMWNRSFDGTTDGFVYGAAAGLGFGMTENFLYFSNLGFEVNLADLATTGAAWLYTVGVRTAWSAVMHGAATATVGACLGFARFRGWGVKLAALPVGFGIAMGLHATWNGLLVAEEIGGFGGVLKAIDFVVVPAYVLLAFVVFQLTLLDQSFTIRRELRAEAALGTLPTAHADALSSWIRRHTGGWLPPHVPRARYVQAATSLALRRDQAARLTGEAGEFYRDEVHRLRRVVARLLAPPTAAAAAAPRPAARS